MSSEVICCRPRSLPRGLRIDAALAAIAHYPANRPALERVPTGMISPLNAAALTTRLWGPGVNVLTVQFLDIANPTLKAKILAHMNAWADRGCRISFKEVAGGGQVRITTTPGDGYYSYVGTDNLSIPANQNTMNLDSFSLSTPDSEYARVVRHETGHALGFLHEQQRDTIVNRINRRAAILYFAQMDGWTAQETTQQVLTPLDEATLTATPLRDVNSVMCYQLPASIMNDHVAVPGGMDIDASDVELITRLYPKTVSPPPPPPPPVGGAFLLTQTSANGKRTFTFAEQ